MNDTAMSPQGQAGLKAMTPAEARASVEAINAHLNGARALLLDLYERRGWVALGYASWRECAVAEFHQSQAILYRELQAAQTERAISTNVEIGTIPASHLRPLASLPPAQQREVWQEATSTAPGGKLTASHVQATADRLAPKEPPVLPTDEAVDVELFDAPTQPRPKKPNVLDGCAPEGTKVKGSAAGYGRALEAVLDELGDIENGLTYYGIRALIADWPKSKTVLYLDGLKTLHGYISKWIKEMEKVT